MRKLLLFISILLFSIASVFGVTPEQSTVQSDVNNIQSAPSYTAPSGYQAKGFVGSILENIFWPGSYLIKNAFITAFQTIEGTFTNNVPRWDGAKFVEGTIYDVSGNVGIGTSSPSEKLHISGNILVAGSITSSTLDVDTNASITGDVDIGRSLTVDTNTFYVDRVGNKIGISTLTPETKLQILGGTDVGPSTGGYIQLGPDSGNNIAIDNNEILARDNGNTADLLIQSADPAGNTVINRYSGNVGIGVSNPTEKLHVAGNIIADTPTLDWHVATKSYVDNITIGIPVCSGTNLALGWDGNSWLCNAVSSGGSCAANTGARCNLIYGPAGVIMCNGQCSTTSNPNDRR